MCPLNREHYKDIILLIHNTFFTIEKFTTKNFIDRVRISNTCENYMNMLKIKSEYL